MNKTKKFMCCNHIFSSICLHPEGLKFCNEVSNSISAIPYNGLSSLEDNENKRQVIINDFKEGKIPSKCQSCSLLYNDDWESKYNDLEIHKLTIFNWLHCNSKCFYCSVTSQYDDKVKKSEYYDALPIVEKLIEEKMITSNTQVDFQGGEPTMLEEFPTILNLLLSVECKLQVLTNGIVYEPLITRMLDKSSENSICISLDSGSRSTFKKIKAIDKFEQVVDNLKKYIDNTRKTNGNIRVKYILFNNVNDNKKEIDAFFNVCKRINVKKISRTFDHRNFSKISNNIRLIVAYDYFEKKCKKYNIEVYHEYWADEHINQLKERLLKKGKILYFYELFKFHFIK